MSSDQNPDQKSELKYDWKEPDVEIYVKRAELLERLEHDGQLLRKTIELYRKKPWEFIADWAMTIEPRNVTSSTKIPMVLFPKQVECLVWFEKLRLGKERGVLEKSRDCGLTWLCVWYSLSIFLFNPGQVVGFGSRKESYIDLTNSKKSIFQRILFALEHTPRIFWPDGLDWVEGKNVPNTYSHMRLMNPATGANIVGEAGDNIGRGDRSSIYFVDEAAFLQNSMAVEAALSDNTNCQIDISTFSGAGNRFYQKCVEWKGTGKHFVFDWRDDPRKSEEWYKKKCRELPPDIVAQEIDRNPHAANAMSFLQGIWVQSCVDAHLKLGFEPQGLRVCSFDPADVGDAKAVICRHGNVIEQAEELKTGDINTALLWAYKIAEDYRADVFIVDGDGMGTPVMKVWMKNASPSMHVQLFLGSGAVRQPNKKLPGDSKLTKERYLNRRAQTWDKVANRMRSTYHAIERAKEGMVVTETLDNLISISSKCKALNDLKAELTMPGRDTSAGKMKVESKRDMKAKQLKSPNLADAFVQSEDARNPYSFRADDVFARQFDNVLIDSYIDPGVGY